MQLPAPKMFPVECQLDETFQFHVSVTNVAYTSTHLGSMLFLLRYGGGVELVSSCSPAPCSSIIPHWEGWWLRASGMHRLGCSGLYFCRMAGGDEYLLRLPCPELLEGLRTTALCPVSVTTSRVHRWDCSFYTVRWTGDNKHVQWATGVCCFLGCPTPRHPTVHCLILCGAQSLRGVEEVELRPVLEHQDARRRPMTQETLLSSG